MALLEIIVYYPPDDWDSEDYPPNSTVTDKWTKDIMIVSTDHICSFNPHDDGETMIHLTNGEVFKCHMRFKKFRQIMEGEEIAKKTFISGEN